METVTFNINPAKKARLEFVYGRIGLSLIDAVNTFFEQSLLADGLPFNVEQPKYNAETEAAMQETRDIIAGKKHVKSYHSARELFDELDAEDADA